MRNLDHHHRRFHRLIDYLARVPSVVTNSSPSLGIGSGMANRIWWVKFGIDIEHPIAWTAVQELGHVLNYVSLNNQLPTTFKPVSPPVYANGGPKDFLSWVIECPSDAMSPNVVAKWLEDRLPRPVGDVSAWEDEARGIQRAWPPFNMPEKRDVERPAGREPGLAEQVQTAHETKKLH